MMVESRKNYRDSRFQFEQDINHLIESIRNGKMILPKSFVESKHGIFQLRYSPNKRLDLNTINESVRAMAMRRITQKFVQEKLSENTNSPSKT